MKTYLADIIPKINRFSQKLDNLTILLNQHWVLIDELKKSKLVYIFRNNFELLISQDGKVEKGKWEYLGNNSLLIERGDGCYLLRHGFLDSNILALKVDGKEEYLFLVNENNYGGDLNSIEKVLYFLELKYLKIISQNEAVKVDIWEIEYKTETNLILDKNLNVVRSEFNKYGYLDKDGNIIIKYQFDGAYDFSGGLARVFKTINNRDYYGFIDEKGNEIVPLKYEYAICFSEDLAVVRLNRMFGYIDTANQIKINIYYDDAESFKNGKALVKKGQKSFYINNKGEII